MAFTMLDYDENVRRVIPLYDEIHAQIIDLIAAYADGKPIAWLDTGAGSGTLARRGAEMLPLSRLVLCDPTERMLDAAKEKLQGVDAEFYLTGSESLRFEAQFDVVTAIFSHHYFDRETRRLAVSNCFRALKNGGLFVCFENTAAFTAPGKALLLRRMEHFGRNAGRSEEEIASHSARYGTEFFPLNIEEHLHLLRESGFTSAEMFWQSYWQCGFYAIR